MPGNALKFFLYKGWEPTRRRWYDEKVNSKSMMNWVRADIIMFICLSLFVWIQIILYACKTGIMPWTIITWLSREQDHSVNHGPSWGILLGVNWKQSPWCCWWAWPILFLYPKTENPSQNKFGTESYMGRGAVINYNFIEHFACFLIDKESVIPNYYL